MHKWYAIGWPNSQVLQSPRKYKMGNLRKLGVVKGVFITLFLILLCPLLGYAQEGRSSDIILRPGLGIGGANIAVCIGGVSTAGVISGGLSTTAATVTADIANLTMSSNPQTAGFAAGGTVIVSGFTAGDVVFNGTFTILSVTSSNILYSLSNANYTASGAGTAFQKGSSTLPCAPLATIYTSSTGLTTTTNPTSSDVYGNYGYYTSPGQYVEQIYGPGVTTFLKPSSIACVPLNSSSCGVLLSAANVFTAPQTITNSGVFTNVAGNQYLQSLVHGATCSTLYFLVQPVYDTDAVDGCMIVPSSASTLIGANAVAGLVQNQSTAVNAVGVYGQGQCTVAGACWGGNFLAQDGVNGAGVAGTTLQGVEIDMNLNSTSYAATPKALGFGGYWSAQPTEATVINISAPQSLVSGTYHYTTGIAILSGATNGNGIQLFPSSVDTISNHNSQAIAFTGNTAGGMQFTASVFASQAGDLALFPSSGKTVILGGGLVTNITGGGTQCVQVSNSGAVTGTGTGCSAPIFTCSTANAFTYWLTSTTGGCDSGITTNLSGQLSATGGLVATSDGVHLGFSSWVGNTTNPVGFPFANSFGWLAPASASFTSWYIQPASATAPAATCLEQLGAVSGNINPLSCPTSVFTSQTDAATVTWAIGSALIANATLTFTAHSGSRALNITNPVNGGSYVIWLKQDSTGGEGLTLGTGCTWKVSGGGSGAITPSTGANAIDVLSFTYDGTNCYANFNKNFN